MIQLSNMRWERPKEEWVKLNIDGLFVATCELHWDFLEEERMMQYSRDKYFPQL